MHTRHQHFSDFIHHGGSSQSREASCPTSLKCELTMVLQESISNTVFGSTKTSRPRSSSAPAIIQQTTHLSQSDPWQTKFTNIYQEICNIKSHTKPKKIDMFISPSYRSKGRVATSGTGEGNEQGGTNSVYSTLLDSGLGHSSDTQRHYNTPICSASPTLLSESPKLTTPHTPPLRSRSWISEPSEEPGLRRACSTDLSQSSSPCVNIPGRLAPNEVAGIVTRGSQGRKT